MATQSITLYVDTVSPFAYIAYYILRHDPAFARVQVNYQPIFLGGLMKACGNTAPLNIKNKDNWINVERLRWSKAFGVPMHESMPPDFPPLTLNIARALCSLQLLDGDQKRLIKVLDLLFESYFVRHEETHKPDILLSKLEATLGKADAAKVMKGAGEEGKKKLTENTDEAFAKGAFGLPWLLCTNGAGHEEGFWGVDHLGQVVQHLGLTMPQRKGWKSLL